MGMTDFVCFYGIGNRCLFCLCPFCHCRKSSNDKHKQSFYKTDEVCRLLRKFLCGLIGARKGIGKNQEGLDYMRSVELAAKEKYAPDIKARIKSSSAVFFMIVF
jgi:hypothetical protein